MPADESVDDFVIGCPGIYTLDCYCNAKSRHHAYDEFPHQFTHELGSTCRRLARKRGWLIDYKRNIFLCPKCNPKSRRYIAEGTPPCP
jgi:hypothetical protein